MSRISAFVKAGAIAAALTVADQAHAVTVLLGASSETFTLYGQGAVAPGIGSFKIGQGASVFDGITSTFTLSGTITGGDAGFNSGSYRFVTTYAGADTPQAGPNSPRGRSNAMNTNQFNYSFLHPTTTITLFLDTPGTDYVIPLFAAGAFAPGSTFSFTSVSPTCTGVAVCTQNNVGLTPGATIFGPVTTRAQFLLAAPVPEPATWAMMVVAFGIAGVLLRRSPLLPRRRVYGLL